MASPEPFRRLRTDAGKLDGLYQDVHALVFSRQDWAGTGFARRTLGDGVPVEVWYLAQHFLLTWHDWQGLWDRCRRYFGQPAERFPRKWSTLNARCRTLAEGLLHDERLDELVSLSWRDGEANELRGTAYERLEARAMYHKLIQNHRRLGLLVAASAWPDSSSAQEKEPTRQRGPVWPKSLEVTRHINDHLALVWENLPWHVRDDGLFHLRHYQRAHLLASWLVEDWARAGRQHSALLIAVTGEHIVTPTIEDFFKNLNVKADERRLAEHVVRRVQGAIAEFGYENFIADVSSGDFLPGDDSPVGSRAINVIPSSDRGNCCTTLLAVSRGAAPRTALSFPKIMSLVKTHLIDCAEQTRVVIFLCDQWSPDILGSHLEDLRAHHRRGVQFLFLLVGTPDRVVSPVAVDLAATP